MKMREEEKKRTSQDSSLKRFFQKRWVFPAIYIASAAIILTAVLWYQTSNDVAEQDEFNYNATDITGKNNPPAIEVNKPLENFVMPVMDEDAAVVQKPFYDVNGTSEEQEKALVSYGNSYQPNTGIDITMKNGETFDVVAALSGTVTKIQEDSFLGNVIEIDHGNNVVTQYQSVKDFTVEVGAQVTQGQPIAKAGQSLLNEEAGVHVHFEIRKDNTPVNPSSYFHKPVSAVQVEKPAENKDATNEEQMNEEDEATTEESNTQSEDQGGADGSDKDKNQNGDTDQPTEQKEESTESDSTES
jgi:stage II sporulation protein Q